MTKTQLRKDVSQLVLGSTLKKAFTGNSPQNVDLFYKPFNSHISFERL